MNPAMSGSPASQPTKSPRDTNTSPPEYQFIVYTLLLILAVLAMPTLMFCRRCPNFTKIFIFKNFLQEVEIIVEAEATIDTEANYANAEALAGEQSIDGTTDIVGEVVARKSRRSAQADGVQAYCVTVMGTTPAPPGNLDRLGSTSRTSVPTIRLTESGLASIASFYPATSVDAESGLDSTRQVIGSELDDVNTASPAPTT